MEDKKVKKTDNESVHNLNFRKTPILRIHNSYIVNLKEVNAVTLNSVEIDGTELPISRSHKEKVLKILNIKP